MVPRATALIEKALEVNPNYVPARTMLARQHLSLEDYREAREHAEKALETNPVSLDALTILAAAEFLAGRHEAFEELSARVFARNPRYADFYNTLSDIAVQNRLYRESSGVRR